MFLAAKQLGSEEAKCDLDAKRQSLLRFELFRKIKKILDLIKRNILTSPLEGEKKFLCELNELRNFREGYSFKQSCWNSNYDLRLYFLKNINYNSDMLHHDKNNKGRLGILAQREAGFEPSPEFLSSPQLTKKFNSLTKREGSDSVISNNYSDTNHSQLTTHYSLISDMVFSRFTSHFSRKRTAFTLAEVLITLGIIGIVACMTLPVLVSKYREQVTVNRLRQVYSLLKQAESMAVNEYGDINTWDFIDLKTMAGIYPGLNTLVFDKYYKPYLKTAKCNYRATIKAANGTPFITIENDYKYVCLPNGTVIYGNTLAGSGYTGTIVYVDLNGKKSPNVVGRDIFTFLINRPVYKSSDYNTDSYRVVPKCPVGISTCFAGPYQGASGYYWKGDEETLIKYCLGGSDSFYTLAGGGNSCAYMIEQAGWKVPKNYPIKM